MSRLSLLIPAAVIACSSVAMASITPLPVGTSITSFDNLTPNTTYQVATTGSEAVTAADFTGTFTESVYSQGGTANGPLAFVFNVSGNGPASIEHFDLGGFPDSTITDVSVTGTGNMPLLMSNNNGLVDVNFGSNSIGNGQSSATITFFTDSLTYSNVNVLVSNNSSGDCAGFAVTPEPQMWGFLSLASLGLLFAARRFKSNTAAN